MTEAGTTLTAADTRDAALHAAVSTWWQLTTFVRVAGPEAVTFLDGVVTQDVAGIEAGSARHALLLTNKARIVAPAIAYRAGADEVLLEVGPGLVDTLLTHLRRYRLRSRVELEHADLGCVSVVGPGAIDVAAGDDWFDTPMFGVPARTYVGSRDDVATLVAELPTRGAPHAEPEALDALRIEHLVPSLSDLLVDRMPAEVGGMEVAVALDKGCYLGQEPVARLHYRGHANRSLRQVRLSGGIPHEHAIDGIDSLALADASGREVGWLTSWAAGSTDSIIGLAVVRADVAEGTPLSLAGGEVTVTPARLVPPVR